MQSKMSLFNRTVFEKNIKKTWPLWGFVTIGACLIPLLIVVQGFESATSRVGNWWELQELYNNILAYVVPYVSAVMAILAAMALWNYLYSSKSTGGMHSFPISRTGLFVTTYLSGLVIMVIPYAVSGIFMIILGLILCGGIPTATFSLILGILLESIFFFSFATLTAHITSNITALPVLYAVFNFIGIIIENMVAFLGGRFLFGVEYSYSDRFSFLSPLVFIAKNVETITDFDNVVGKQIADYGYGPIEIDIYGSYVSKYWLLVVYGAVGIALFFLSLCIYRKRKNETAGDVIAVRGLKPVIIAIFTAVTSFCGALVLYTMFANSYSRYVPWKYLICLIVAGTIGYIIGNMLVEKTIKIFNKHVVIGLIVSYVVYIMLVVTLGCDFLGVEKRVPDSSSIKSIEVRIEGNRYTIDAKKYPEVVKTFTDMHKVIVESEALIDMRNIGGSDYYYNDDYHGIQISMTYRLKGGSNLSRSYYVYIDIEGKEELDNVILQYLSRPDVNMWLLHTDENGKVTWGRAYINGNSAKTIEIVNAADCKALWNAIVEDTKDGSWGAYKHYLEYEPYHGDVCIELDFEIPSNGDYVSDWISIYLNKNMVNTIDALSRIGDIPKESIIDALDWFDEESYEAYEHYNKYGYSPETAIYEDTIIY